MGPFRLSLYLDSTELFGYSLLLLYVVLGMEIYIIHVHTFIISLLFIIHDKIIMLIGTWRTTRENSATTRVVWERPWLTN
jgi:predicted ferric reductase